MTGVVRSLVCSVVFLAACAVQEQPVDVQVDDELALDLVVEEASRSAWAGTPEGIAVLDFLNAETTTFEILDVEVPLDRRAAGNLIAHRDGGDGLWGTTDDDIYNTLDEVDSVRWVGSKSIDRMVDYVVMIGLVPTEGDYLGSWDSVSFTVDEADLTLSLANSAEIDFLDHDLGLDSRAVDSIIDARPIETVEDLAGLYYVGTSALTTLKDAAVDEWVQ